MAALRSGSGRFPIAFALVPAIVLGAGIVLLVSGRIAWAVATAMGALLTALPLFGWILARGLVEAEIVRAAIANGGRLRDADVEAHSFGQHERSLERLSLQGVLVRRDDVLHLERKRIRGMLRWFLRLRTATAQGSASEKDFVARDSSTMN
jgi:hypothetical protein